MEHVESATPLPPPPGRATAHLTPGTWQEAALPLVKLVLWHVHRLCRAAGVPPSERDDVAGEALVNLCAGMKNAFGRGPRAVNCRYHAQNGLAAVLNTRRGRPLRLLADAVADPEAALA